jgi:hypothetical protein
MLARRFTIVCLVAMLFGLLFADLAARGERVRFAAGTVHAGCGWIDQPVCRLRRARF